MKHKIYALLIFFFVAAIPSAHATLIYSQTDHGTLDSSNCGLLQPDGTTFDTSSCGLFVGTKVHLEYATTTTDIPLNASSTVYASFYAGMDWASWGSFLGQPQVLFVSGTCTFSGNIDKTLLSTTDLSHPAYFSNVPLTYSSGSCSDLPTGTSFYFSFGNGNWNGQIASFINGIGSHWLDYMILSTSAADDTGTRIDWIDPQGGNVTVATSTSITLSSGGYVNAADIPLNSNGDPETATGKALSINYRFTTLSRFTNCHELSCIQNNTGEILGGFATSSRENLLLFSTSSQAWTDIGPNIGTAPSGGYQYIVTLDTPRSFFGLTNIFGLTFGYTTLATKQTIVVVGTTTAFQNFIINQLQHGGDFNSTTTAQSLTTCLPVPGYFDIQDCVQTLFVPQQLPDFSTPFQAIQQKVPFGYWYQVSSILKGATTTDATTTPISDLSYLLIITTPIDLAISSVLWLVFVIWIFRRVKDWDFQA